MERLGLSGALDAARQSGQFEWEALHRRSGQGLFWANTVITPLDEAGGDRYGFALITRDVPERRRAAELLQASQRDLRGLSAHLQWVVRRGSPWWRANSPCSASQGG